MKLFRRGNAKPLSEIRSRVRIPALPVPPPEPVAPAVAPPAFSYRDPRPADQAVPFALKVTAGIAWRVVVIAAALYGVGMVIGKTSSVVIPVAVALLLTALTMPLAVFLNHRLKFPRGLAAITTLLVAVGVVLAPAREGDLSGMVAQRGRSFGEQQFPALGPVGEQHQDGGRSRVRRWVGEARGEMFGLHRVEHRRQRAEPVRQRGRTLGRGHRGPSVVTSSAATSGSVGPVP